MLARSAGVRAFCTSAPSNISRKAQRQIRRRRDDQLRDAIALYHLTPSFYPPESTDKTDSGKPGSQLEDSVTESILGPFFGERDGRPFVQFATTAELMHQYQQDARRGKKDTRGELDMYDTLRIKHAVSVDARSYAPSTGVEDAIDAPVRMRQHFVHPPSAYPSRRARDAAGHGDLYSSEEMSLRSAQVRDALFGTVAGELPGLEAVRDRERAWKKGDQEEK
ncbi:hypothetical protein MVES_002667 [Malassezia vespertilionis]|uniref:Uncharacterized protein n=2 Tax=Malassezia vespertilionis TaxID=2020962 RepID=A0A2N1JAI2_9BASI|nr:hypothetical protein MVES_002667 [Malassezia vespertilionis]